MNENDILEQPISNDTNSQKDVNRGESEVELENGSNILNKFKSVEALNLAYNNLQAEFTKKCQRLSELEKETEKNNIPKYKLDSWADELDNFFKENPKAKEYSKEIAKTIIDDEELAKKSECLNLAWGKILSKKNLSENDLVENSEFLNNYIYNNEKIKDEIIKQYISKKEKAPLTMTNNKGASLNLTPKQKPKSMEDAYSIVKELFK